MKKWFPALIGFFSVLAVLVVAYVWIFRVNATVKDISQKEADYLITAQELIAEFSTDTAGANKKYTNKIIELSGKVSRIEKTENITSLVFDINASYIVSAELTKEHASKQHIEEGQEVVLKAFYAGFLPEEDILGMNVQGNILLTGSYIKD